MLTDAQAMQKIMDVVKDLGDPGSDAVLCIAITMGACWGEARAKGLDPEAALKYAAARALSAMGG